MGLVPARAARAFGRAVLRCGPGDLGRLGGNGDLHRSHPLRHSALSTVGPCLWVRFRWPPRATICFRRFSDDFHGMACRRSGSSSRQSLRPCWFCRKSPDRPALKAFYDLVVGLSTMAAVIPYAFCALATGLVAAYVAGGGPVPRLGLIEVIAFVFAVFTLYGCGRKGRALRHDHARARHTRLRLAAAPRRSGCLEGISSVQKSNTLPRCRRVGLALNSFSLARSTRGLNWARLRLLRTFCCTDLA